MVSGLVLDDLRILASGLMEFVITIPWHMNGFENSLRVHQLST